MNKIEDMSNRFKAVTCSMDEYQYECFPNIVINTSCEHITQDTYNRWLQKIPLGSLIILQSNDYFELDEHIRCAIDIDDFISQSNIKVWSSATLELSKYNRFMIIGSRK